MAKFDRLDTIVGATAQDKSGDKIGKVGTLYLDNASDQPKWVSVNTGLFGMKESLVPLEGATQEGDKLVLAYSKDKIKDAPHLDAEDGLTAAQEEDLFRYYGLTSTTTTQTAPAAGTGTAAAGTAAGTVKNEGEKKAPVGGQDELIRSEEQLRVGTAREEAGKARIKKYVVSEKQTVNVPVTHEEVEVERQAISPEEAARLKNTQIGQAEAEVTLHQDRVVVDKETVPVEKVRLNVNKVTEDRAVTEEVRKERIDTDVNVDKDLKR